MASRFRKQLMEILILLFCRGLFNKERIAKCKKGVLVVNNARGAIMDTQAVVDACNSGHIGGNCRISFLFFSFWLKKIAEYNSSAMKQRRLIRRYDILTCHIDIYITYIWNVELVPYLQRTRNPVTYQGAVSFWSMVN